MTLLLSIGIFGIYSAALLAIGGVGFTLQFGVTNVLNLAFGSLLTACIFIEYGLTGHSTNLWVAMAVGAASGALISLLVGHVVVGAFLRRGATGIGIAMVTIAISLIVQFSLEAIQGPFIFAYTASTPSTFSIGGVVVSSSQLTVIGVAVVAMVAVHLLLRMTKLGLAMRATAADVSLTRSCGVSPARTRAAAWLLSGALCGVCGVLLGIGEGSFSSSTGSDFFITLAAAAVLGGIGKPYGAMLGALLIGIVSQAAAAVISPSYKTIAAWLILIAVLILRPQGILAEFASERELVA
ncbi:MAG TPA: branched-chain amino acid ABC transporter permease [Streptosporangiaceae bacterium]|nr:branched-chain amino acid ABC transporter permease [Streptosporangiaceae bacterium]